MASAAAAAHEQIEHLGGVYVAPRHRRQPGRPRTPAGRPG